MAVGGFFVILYGLSILLFGYYLSFMHTWYTLSDWIFQAFENDTVFDYIIVGAGSAGAVIASKLAGAGKKTLLLEAGGPPPNLIDIPIIAPLLQQSVYDWKYITEPQENSCFGLVENRSVWPMGKILGGSSRLNYMAYVRGHPLDYENWFPDFHDCDSLNAESLRWSSQFSDAILEGAREIGQPIQNINNGAKIGFMKVELTQKNGARWSTDKMLKKSQFLTIVTNAHVQKVILDNLKTARGIEFVTLRKNFRAFAKKGVILSAGAIGTPKILMLSGIGPKNHLEKLGIKVVANLPVGKNLMDHILTGLDLVTLKTSLSLTIKEILNPVSMLDYFIFGKGPWSFPGLELVGTFHSDLTTNQSKKPDLQIVLIPVGISQNGGEKIGKLMGISDKVYEKYFAPMANESTISILPILLHPKSTGEVTLRSNNPNDDPIINPRYLTEKDDLETLIKGLDFVKKLVKTRKMQEFGAAINEKHFPGCEEHDFDTFNYWKCYVSHLTLTMYHPAGTCRMGYVTDQSFRVREVKNLYIADASVLPVLPSGNINAAVVMLAKKAAKVILKNSLGAVDATKCNRLDVFLFLHDDV